MVSEIDLSRGRFSRALMGGRLSYVSKLVLPGGEFVIKYGDKKSGMDFSQTDIFCFGDAILPQNAEQRHPYELERLIQYFDAGLPVIEPFLANDAQRPYLENEFGPFLLTRFEGKGNLRYGGFSEEGPFIYGIKALAELHSRGFFHGDPNPSNLLVKKDGAVWCDLDSRFPPDLQPEAIMVRDLRIYLSGIYIQTGQADLVSRCLENYADKEIEKKLKEQLEEASEKSYAGMLNLYEKTGFGNPLKLLPMLRGDAI